MSESTIVRVVMHLDYSVHVQSDEFAPVACTAEMLAALLRAPSVFIGSRMLADTETKAKVNANKQFITLLTVGQDAKVHCFAPILYEALFDGLQNAPSAPLNLNEYVNRKQITDVTQVLLRFFCEFAGVAMPVCETNIDLLSKLESHGAMIQEMIHSSFLGVRHPDPAPPTASMPPKEKKVEAKGSTKAKETQQSKDSDVDFDTERYLSSNDYAAKFGTDEGRIKEIVRKKLVPFIRIGKNIFLDSWAEYPAYQRISPARRTHDVFRQLCPDSPYLAVQKYMKANQMVPEEIRPFIRTYEEICFYEKHGFYSLMLDGRHILLVNVPMDLYSPEHGKTNEEIVTEKKTQKNAPVDFSCRPFHVHHIGQRKNSPLCVLPEEWHRQANKILHLAPSREWSTDNDDDLHDAVFTAKKDSLWMAYLEVWREAGGCFEKIKGLRKVKRYPANAE